MADKPATPSKLADIIKYRRQQGSGIAGSLAGGIKEKLKEKFDPRQIFDQQGILTALFPGLKAFKAATGPKKELKDKITPSISFEEIIPTLEKINANTRIISKNMMVLPAMHRDINVMRQNIGKLVKLRGANASTKADMYFMKAKDREAAYEEQFKRVPTRISPSGSDSGGQEQSGGEGSILANFASGIIGAIVSLGKAITAAFSTLAGIVKSLLIQLGQAIFRVVLKSIGTFLVTAISDFIKNLGLSALIFRLIKFILRPVLWPLAIAAAAYVAAEYLKENPFDFLDESNISSTANSLPMPAMKAGEELALGIKTATDTPGWKGTAGSRDWSKVKEEETSLNKPTLDDLKSGKKKTYNLWFPGLIQRASIALTDGEAQDLAKKYTALLSLTKARAKETKESKPNPEKINNIDGLIKDLTASIRNTYKDAYVKSYKPEFLQNEDVKKFIDMMDRKIKYPEMGPIESRIAKKVDDTFEGLQNLKPGDLSPNFQEAEKNLRTEMGKITIDPSQFSPSLQAPASNGTGTGQQINQKTGDVKDSKQSSIVDQTDIKVSSLSTQKGTSSVTHVPEVATPWNMDMIDNLLTGQRAMMG
jgi:hypothetical protein